MYENEIIIELNDLDQVKEFVYAASSCDFDIDVKYNRTYVDAKSILGVMALGLNKKLHVLCGGTDEKFQSVVNRLATV